MNIGKRRSGPIFSKRQSCRFQYRQRLRQTHFVADKFCSHFKHSFTCNNTQKYESLRKEFEQAYESYCGLPMADPSVWHWIRDDVMTTYLTSIIHRFSPKRYREKCRSTERLFYSRLLETLSFVLCLGDLNLSLDYISTAFFSLTFWAETVNNRRKISRHHDVVVTTSSRRRRHDVVTSSSSRRRRRRRRHRHHRRHQNRIRRRRIKR